MWDSKTSNEITDMDVPTPSPLPEVMGYNVLIRPVSIREKTKGSIILPDAIREDMSYLSNAGTVLALGPLAYDADIRRRRDEALEQGDLDLAKFYSKQIKYSKPWVEVGDTVVLPKHSGTRFKFKGVLLCMIQDDKIALKVQNADDINPGYSAAVHS